MREELANSSRKESSVVPISGVYPLVWSAFTFLNYGPGWAWVQCDCRHTFYVDAVGSENISYEGREPHVRCPGCGKESND